MKVTHAKIASEEIMKHYPWYGERFLQTAERVIEDGKLEVTVNKLFFLHERKDLKGHILKFNGNPVAAKYILATILKTADGDNDQDIATVSGLFGLEEVSKVAHSYQGEQLNKVMSNLSTLIYWQRNEEWTKKVAEAFSSSEVVNLLSPLRFNELEIVANAIHNTAIAKNPSIVKHYATILLNKEIKGYLVSYEEIVRGILDKTNGIQTAYHIREGVKTLNNPSVKQAYENYNAIERGDGVPSNKLYMALYVPIVNGQYNLAIKMAQGFNQQPIIKTIQSINEYFKSIDPHLPMSSVPGYTSTMHDFFETLKLAGNRTYWEQPNAVIDAANKFKSEHPFLQIR